MENLDIAKQDPGEAVAPIKQAGRSPGRANDAKSPALATLLSLFPGVGQLYNGELAKGVAFVSAVGTCVFLIGSSDAEPFFALLLAFIYFYGLIDAYQSAQRINLMALSGVTPKSMEEPSPVWGTSLVGMGFLLLAHNFGLFRFEWLTKFWPLILVGAGVSLLRGSLWGRNS